MVIGFYGKAGSGKSTAIETLKARGKPVYLVKFAGTLYAIQNFIYSAIADVYTPPEGFVKDRELLQWLGTDWGRSKDEALWIKKWKKTAEKALARDPELTVVSDDTRFDNEAETIRSMGGVVVHIVRPDASAHAVGGTGIANHASESGIRPELVDYTIQNTGDLAEYQKALGELFDRIQRDRATAA